ncbi:hypothetical protein GCM10008018_20420 [Paenibacillus marchantiophytorum]|uniref:Uncharacterized protein n=1 Tax=Paenibacillus marchantiophytorum TaxID=1619310 RepID=A0ABQ2BXP7_9BACL|nr:hypothetical protein [Paenibacillus marchantiophytorum]GGI47090.1 hypothetical protein GCM10008018_20420 [Paenibacillus marchantiophytorum]
MRKSSKFASLLVVILFVVCTGIVSAAGLKDDRTLEERTGRTFQEMSKQPSLAEGAKGIVTDYLNALIKEGGAGGAAPLAAYSLGHADTSNTSDIKVGVTLKYKDDVIAPKSVNYSVVQVKDTYQVKPARVGH